MALEHPEIMHSHLELLFENGDWKQTLVIQTGLQIQEGRPDYDGAALNDLMRAIADHMRSNPMTVDSVVVRSRRADA